MRYSRFRTAMVAVLFLSTSAATCQAGDIYAYLNTPNNNGCVVIGYNLVNGKGYTGGTQSGNYGYAGIIPWTVQSGGTDTSLGSAGTNFKTFCIQISQDVYIGQTSHFASVASWPGGAVSGAGGPTISAGSPKILEMELLFGTFYNTTVNGGYGKTSTGSGITTTSSNDILRFGAAFQLAVWEILYDGASSATNSLTTGIFTATDVTNAGGQTGIDVLNTAQYFVNQVYAYEHGTQTGGKIATNLVALTDGTLQDQISFTGGSVTTTNLPPPPATPEPASMTLGVIGGLMLTAFGYRGRKRNQKVG